MTGSEIADNSVGSVETAGGDEDEIVDGSVDSQDLAPGAVTMSTVIGGGGEDIKRAATTFFSLYNPPTAPRTRPRPMASRR